MLQPLFLDGPIPGMAPGDQEGSSSRAVPVWSGLPGGATDDLLKSKLGVESDRPRVVIAHVKPRLAGVAGAGVVDGRDGQRPADTFAPVVGVGGHVGDQIDLPVLITMRNEADIADDLPVFLPNVTGKGHG